MTYSIIFVLSTEINKKSLRNFSVSCVELKDNFWYLYISLGMTGKCNLALQLWTSIFQIYPWITEPWLALVLEGCPRLQRKNVFKKHAGKVPCATTPNAIHQQPKRTWFSVELDQNQWQSILQKAHLKMLSIGSQVTEKMKSYRMGLVHIPSGSVQS